MGIRESEVRLCVVQSLLHAKPDLAGDVARLVRDAESVLDFVSSGKPLDDYPSLAGLTASEIQNATSACS